MAAAQTDHSAEMESRQMGRLSSLGALIDAYGEDPSVNYEIGARYAAACPTGCDSSLSWPTAGVWYSFVQHDTVDLGVQPDAHTAVGSYCAQA